MNQLVDGQARKSKQPVETVAFDDSDELPEEDDSMLQNRHTIGEMDQQDILEYSDNISEEEDGADNSTHNKSNSTKPYIGQVKMVALGQKPKNSSLLLTQNTTQLIAMKKNESEMAKKKLGETLNRI